MEELPSMLRSLVSEAEAGAVRDWWGRLAGSDRQALAAAYDERWEKCFFGPTPEGDALPAVLSGWFQLNDDASRFTEWEADWREYLVEHPDVSLMSGMFSSGSWHLSSGNLNIWVDWRRTRFKNEELPPSERRTRRTKSST